MKHACVCLCVCGCIVCVCLWKQCTQQVHSVPVIFFTYSAIKRSAQLRASPRLIVEDTSSTAAASTSVPDVDTPHVRGFSSSCFLCHGVRGFLLLRFCAFVCACVITINALFVLLLFCVFGLCNFSFIFVSLLGMYIFTVASMSYSFRTKFLSTN